MVTNGMQNEGSPQSVRGGMILEEKIVKALNDPETFSKCVATAFFRALKRAGCSDPQIIAVASDVIGCLIDSLNKFEKRRRKVSV
ncbi:MAG: hypothetical protein GXP58_05415 [Deltaproteobacteria bacterium]|nr:hypothetical protein [Deltaproteobacteria bacterium]